MAKVGGMQDTTSTIQYGKGRRNARHNFNYLYIMAKVGGMQDITSTRQTGKGRRNARHNLNYTVWQR